MENKKNMTKINLITKMILVIFILLSGCKKEPVLEPDYINSNDKEQNIDDHNSRMSDDPNYSLSQNFDATTVTASCFKLVDLIAGKNTKVGTVMFKRISGDLQITYKTIAPWKIVSVNFYMGPCGQIPLYNNGTPKTSLFPYKFTYPGSGVTTANFSVPTRSPSDCGCVSAKAVVVSTGSCGSTETAWGKGIKFTGNSYSMYYQYCMAICPQE